MIDNFLDKNSTETRDIIISVEKKYCNFEEFQKFFPIRSTLPMYEVIKRSKLFDDEKIGPRGGTLTLYSLDDFFSDFNTRIASMGNIFIQHVRIKTTQKYLRNSAIVRGVEEYQDNAIVKRLFCDCCGAYYDYPLSLGNQHIDIEFICYPCENNVLDDLAQNPATARNNIEELAVMRKRLEEFNKDNECLLGECTDFYEQTEVSEKQIKDYINTGEFHV